MISYAQNFEDVLLHRAFRKQEFGMYVDVGAHDPHLLSVTKLFYLHRGWSGINIEPVVASYQKFLGERPRDINLNVAAGATAGELILMQTSDAAYSSLSAGLLNGYHQRDRAVEKAVSVPVRTLTDILQQYAPDTPIDFLKIDVEGWEKQVLDGTDFNRFRPAVLVIEAIRPDAVPEDFYNNLDKFAAWYDWEPQVLAADYRFAYFDGLNRFYVAGERSELLAFFAVPVGPLYDAYAFSSRPREKRKRGLLERLANSARKRLMQTTSTRVQ